jgi:hypothetical protein
MAGSNPIIEYSDNSRGPVNDSKMKTLSNTLYIFLNKLNGLFAE